MDAIEFDSNYTCSCYDSFEGSNCDATVVLEATYHGAKQFSNSTTQYTPTSRTRWAIGATYLLAPVNVTSARTTAGAVVDVATIAYQLDPNPPGFFIDSDTGAILGQPGAAGTYTSTLYATSPGSQRDALVMLSFEFRQADIDSPANGPGGRDCLHGTAVEDEAEFNGIFNCSCFAGWGGPNCDVTDADPSLVATYHGPTRFPDSSIAYTPTTRTQWAIGSTYLIAAANVTAAATDSGAAVNVSDITYRLVPNPPGFFVDSGTGEILGSPTATGSHIGTLYASSPGTQPDPLVQMVFEFLVADIDVAANGPNNRGCVDGDPMDAIEFDSNYTCSCYRGFALANCDLSLLPDLEISTVEPGLHDGAGPQSSSTVLAAYAELGADGG